MTIERCGGTPGKPNLVDLGVGACPGCPNCKSVHSHREEPCACEPPEEIIALQKRIAELEAALQEIVNTQGQVCPNFEECTHAACNSSYSSWAIAEAALRKEKA